MHLRNALVAPNMVATSSETTPKPFFLYTCGFLQKSPFRALRCREPQGIVAATKASEILFFSSQNIAANTSKATPEPFLPLICPDPSRKSPFLAPFLGLGCRERKGTMKATKASQNRFRKTKMKVPLPQRQLQNHRFRGYC